MKIIKRILLVLLVLVAVLAAVGLFLPGSSTISRSLAIQAPPENVYSLVGNLKAWNRWSAWHKMDTAMRITWGGPEESVGSWYSWESTNGQVGTGKITITAAVPFDSILTRMEFMGDSSSPAWGSYTFKSNGGSTTLTMTMRATYGYNLIARYFGLFLKGEIEKGFDSSLERIRAICEGGRDGAAKGNYLITETWQNEQPYLFVRDTATMASIGAKFAANFGLLMQAAAEAKTAPSGPPFAVIHRADSIMDLEWGVPVNATGAAKGDVQLGVLPAKKILKADYYGPYDGSEPAYKAMAAYAAAHGLTISSSFREVYITDPMKDPDPKHWLTYILCEVK